MPASDSRVVHLEGNFFSRDFLARLNAPNSDLPYLSPDSYGLGESGRVRERIAQSWNTLSARHTRFADELARLREGDNATTLTRRDWLLPLLEELGFGRVQSAAPLEALGKEYTISHGWNQTPMHLLGAKVPLDKRSLGVIGAAQAAPHALVQELLNRSEAHRWALLSNGRKLRLLRDSANIARQSYVEFDLQAIFENEDAPAFALLWLLCHASRFENDGLILEAWQKLARAEGERALDQLRVGVEQAIATLASGFLAHPNNTALREALREGQLTPLDFYRETLRLVYRVLFVLVAETKDALLLPGTSDETRATYTDYFSLSRLKTKAGKRKGDAHFDLWRGLRLSFGLLRGGESRLGIPALGGFLFEPLRFDECDISNRDLLQGLRDLAWFESGGMRREVNFNLGSEELGSVYESLLELSPDLDLDARRFELRILAGNERKTTGSYYTPEILVKSLLETALEPLLERALQENEREAALLGLLILDPACGSGHFLTAAARRVARELAFVRSGGDEPTLDAHRTAMRDVISHCVYGIDINPMAVELCKVALWMEALEPGKPLSFLDSHIRCGNALLGTTPELLEGGIPDAAFAPLEGDDKAMVAAYKKQNKTERAYAKHGFYTRSLFDDDGFIPLGDLGSALAKIESAPENSLEQVQAKQQEFSNWMASAPYRHTHLLADSWCAAFVWRRVKESDPEFIEPITQNDFMHIRRHARALIHAQEGEIKRLAEVYKWFHPHIEFPSVMKKGGFDLVLGNPPWERVKLQEKEFFSTRAPEIANAPNAARRKAMIDELEKADSGQEPDKRKRALWQEFQTARRTAEGESHFARSSGRYPLCGVGDVNTYALFAEANRNFIDGSGRVGCIVPSGIATDDTTKAFFGSICDQKQLASLFDIENKGKAFFPDVHASFKFCLLTLSGTRTPIEAAQFVFFAHNDTDLTDPTKRFSLSPVEIALLNPNTKTCPIFRTTRDAELTKAIYRRVPVLVNEATGANPWGIYYIRLVHLDDHKEFVRFRRSENEPEWDVPVYESKLMVAYDHRMATFEGVSDQEIIKGQARQMSVEEKKNPDNLARTRYVVPRYFKQELRAKYSSYKRRFLLAWRDICRSTDERTCIPSILPDGLTTVSCPVLGFSNDISLTSVFANLASFIVDYCTRQKVGGTHLSYGIFKQLPILEPDIYEQSPAWVGGEVLRDWILRRVVELCYTAVDLEPFARDCGYDGEPFVWNEERRFQLRCELDAAFFRLYGLSREEVDYVMDTFPIVRRKDEAAFGSYRTKETILAVLDGWQ